MKIALVHDYLTQRGGAERVFELLCRHYPQAHVYTALYDAQQSIDLGERIVNTTILQKLPGAAHYFRLLAPLYFPAFRALDLSEYDLIISSSTSFAKSVRKRPDAQHICFCHNITRFLWDTKTYLREYRKFQTFYPVLERIFRLMRKIDLQYAQEPDLYIANSSIVAQRIQAIYGRQALVINYPIDDKKFTFSEQKDSYHLVSTRLISYKRVDVIVEAFNWLGWPLLITGDGPEREHLERRALNNVVFLGHVSDTERTRLMSRANAVVVAALEDYGLVPVEANASGTPVVAYGKGGVLDTQVPGKTGVFFDRQAPDSLHRALLNAADIQWNYSQIRKHALSHFSEAAFFERVDHVMKSFTEQMQTVGSGR